MKMGDEYVAVARQVPFGTGMGQSGTPQKPVIIPSSTGTIPFKGIVPKEKETNKEREDDESAWWVD
jgi:hypothetical protein